MMRLPRALRLLILFSLLSVAIFILENSFAQEPTPDQPASDFNQNAIQKSEKPTDNATLNLHRWGAVTLFHGLPSDRVNAIAEDANGVLWFGTDNGLVRYDGRNVEAAPYEALLPSRRILALKLDHRGDLWIGLVAGAARLRTNQIAVEPTNNRSE